MHVVMHHDMLSPLFHNSVLDVQHLQQVASLEHRNRNQRPKLTHFWCEWPSVKSFDYAGPLFHGKTMYWPFNLNPIFGCDVRALHVLYHVVGTRSQRSKQTGLLF